MTYLQIHDPFACADGRQSSILFTRLLRLSSVVTPKLRGWNLLDITFTGCACLELRSHTTT